MVQKGVLLFLIGVIIIFLVGFQLNELDSIESKTEIEKLLLEKDRLLNEEKYDLALGKLLNIKDFYIKNKNWNEAVIFLNKATDLHLNIFPDSYSQEEYIREAINIIQEHIKDETTLAKAIAVTYQNMGQIHLEANQKDSATHYLSLSINLFATIKDWHNLGWAKVTLAVNYYYGGDFVYMKKQLKEAELLVKTHELSPDILDAIYDLLGVFYFHTEADYEKAIEVTEHSLQLVLEKESKSGQDSFHIANIYNNLGVYFLYKRDFTRAGHYFEVCLHYFDLLGIADENKVDVLANYGIVNFELKKHPLAIQFFQKSLFLGKEQNNKSQQIENELSAYQNLTTIYDRIEHQDSALFYVNKGIELIVSQKQEDPFFYFLKARVLLHQKQFVQAKEIISSHLNRKTQGTLIFDLQRDYLAYQLLGEIYRSLKDYDQSLFYYQKALVSNIPNFNDTTDFNQPHSIENAYIINNLIKILQEKAITFNAIGTFKSKYQAFKNYELAIEWAEKLRLDFTFEESKIKLNEETAELYSNAVAIAYDLYSETNDEKYLKEAFIIVEKQKAILLLESLIDAKGKQYYGVPEHSLNRERSLKNSIAFYQQKVLEAEKNQDEPKIQMYKQYYTDFNVQLANLKDSLQAYYENYFKLEYQSSIADIPAVQKELLKENQVFVQYFTTDSLTYAFIIEKNKSHFIAVPNTEKEKLLLQHFQATLRSPQGLESDGRAAFQEFTTLSHQAYQLIFEPIIKKVSPQTTGFLIAADGSLNYLPFEVLLNQAIENNTIDFIRLPYLIKKYQFHYGYSGTLLLENQYKYNEVPANDKCFAVAPLYETSPIIAQRGDLAALNNQTAPLKGTAKEVQAISKHFNGTFDFSETATKENFVKKANDYGILHLAMHGKPDMAQPKYAHLIFSNTIEDTPSSHLLYHYEVANLKMKAQMAVLSACETGVGKAIEGEGVMSLGRGFMYAGIPSVVMSYWKMNDLSTSQLMPMFYEKLAKGMRKDVALHEAKIEYLENATMENAHPFYWAGFIGIGDARPIKQNKSTNLFYLIGGAGLFLFSLFFLFQNQKSKFS